VADLQGLNQKIQPAFQAAFLRKNCDKHMEIYRTYCDAALELARTDMAVPGPEEISGYKKSRDRLIQQRDTLENNLKTACPVFANQMAQDTAQAKQVIDALGPDEILVEYIRLRLNYHNPRGDRMKSAGTIRSLCNNLGCHSIIEPRTGGNHRRRYI
jgi:hypothetical protein